MTAAPKLESAPHKMTCINCQSNDWENVDAARLKPSGMSICKGCGFTSYPSKWQSYDALKKHYRKAYRTPPTSNNYYTGQRKIHFHNAFLQPVFSEWKEKGIEPKVFEVGAAFGMVLNWLKGNFPQGTFSGTEWTTAYKRVAKHEYGLELVDDFDSTTKHDLIISYKVAEHQLDVDKELRKYAEALSDNGYLYISVPTWFDTACNFGLGGFDIEYYYDPNHINVWTREHFENILQRAGFEIIKKDYVMYDSTYLCKRNDANLDLPVLKLDPEAIKEKMARIKQAHQLFQQQRYDEAISVYPDYPAAWISKAETYRKEFFTGAPEDVGNKIKAIVNSMLQACPYSADILVTSTDLLMRAELWEDAIRFAEEALKAKPESPSSLAQLIHIMRELALRSRRDGDKKGENHYWMEGVAIARHLQGISTQHFGEALNFIYQYSAQVD